MVINRRKRPVLE